MDKKLKKNVLVGGSISAGIGIIYLITTVILAGTSYKYLTEPLLNSVGLPLKLVMNIVSLIGCSTLDCVIVDMTLALILYFIIGAVIGLIIDYSKKLRKK